MLNKGKAPGYDLVTEIILQKLPRKSVLAFTHIINLVLRTQHMPVQWTLRTLFKYRKLVSHQLSAPFMAYLLASCNLQVTLKDTTEEASLKA